MKYWRKWLCLVLALAMLMLAGCVDADSGRRRKERDKDAQSAQSSSVEFEYYEMDGSWYNQNGDVLVSHVYRAVAVLGDTEVAEKINAAVEADGSAFLANQSSRIYSSDEEMEKFLQMADAGYGDLCHDTHCEVTHNDNGILSIRAGVSWYLGGVFTADYYGMTFDLKSGEKLNVLQVIGGDPTQAEEKLNEIICEYVTEAYGEGLFDAPERILEDYSAQEYNFYVEEGQIFVTFNTYTFAPGQEGATVVPTGIMVGE